MLTICSRILERLVLANDPVVEMRTYASAAVEARIDLGRKRAIENAARELGISARRVAGLLRGEVPRIWADELVSARSWYRHFLEREQAKSEHRALILRAQREALDAGDNRA